MYQNYREKIETAKKTIKKNYPLINNEDIESFIREIIWPRIDEYE